MQFLKSYEEFTKKENAFVIKVDRDISVPAKKFPGGKYLNFYIRIYLDIDKKIDKKNIYDLNDVSLVKYKLHRSYMERYRISEDSKNNFELHLWTYGFYPIQATVYLKLGGSIIVNGNVEFNVTDEEKKINKKEIEN